MKIYFAGDHAGFEMKGQLIEFVRSLGHKVEDLGPHSFDKNDDFPDFVIPLAKKVASYSPFPSAKGGSASGGKGSTREGEGFKSSASEALGTSFKKGGIEEVRGIITAASGQAEVMCANRFKGVRAALYYGPASRRQTDASGKELDIVASTRQHNNANILSLGARFINEDEAKAAVKLWLETPFSGDERHVRRLAKIDSLADR